MKFDIPVMRPTLPIFSEVEPLLREIDLNHIYSNRGPLVQELESKYAQYLGTQPELVVAVANATQALQGLVAISEISDWCVPDYTFTATGLSVLNANKNLILCDVDRFSWKLDITGFNHSSDSVGIIPVMPFGADLDFTEYLEFENVIIDAAASLGRNTSLISKMKKNWSIVFSLHATKVLGAGEGAIVACGNSETAEILRAWINFGFRKDRVTSIAGTNAKMSEFNAAYGLTSLNNIHRERQIWLKAQNEVSELSKDKTWSTWVNQEPAFQPYWIVDLGSEPIREIVATHLANAGIQTREWWGKPLSKQFTFLQNKTYELNSNSSYLASAHLGLPMFPGISSENISLIIYTLEEAIQKNGLVLH